jgi:IrrE N-terminal-like domain
MRWYGPTGDRRLWFDDDEIECIAEEELRAAGLTPSQRRPVADLERFVEHHLGVELDQYASLEADVLGLTEFVGGRASRISINADLTGAALDDEDASVGLVGRWRATLAHECAHVVLHNVLFRVDERQADLFQGAPNSAAHGLMRCLKRDVGPSVQVSDWREVQANRGMAALLMPRELFRHVAGAAMSSLGISAPATGSPDASVLASEVAVRFGVSRQAAKIRLATLNVTVPAGTARLPST